jgi:hypothetical protein
LTSSKTDATYYGFGTLADKDILEVSIKAVSKAQVIAAHNGVENDETMNAPDSGAA